MILVVRIFSYNNSGFVELVGIFLIRSYNRHNSLLVSVLKWPYTSHIHKSIGMHLSAFPLLFDVRILDR